MVYWKPASYRHVWLVAAPFAGSGALIGGLVAGLINGGFAVGRSYSACPWPFYCLRTPWHHLPAVIGVSTSQVGVAWPPDASTNPVIQDFVRCCLDNKPDHRGGPAERPEDA